MSITLELHPLVDGRRWNCYAVEFQTADGVFTTYIYALSDDHAAMVLDELKSTAKVMGQVVQSVGGAKP